MYNLILNIKCYRGNNEFNREEVDKKSETEISDEDELKEASIADLHSILKKKVDAINAEMEQFSNSVNDFSLICDNELNTLLKNLETVQNAMNQMS